MVAFRFPGLFLAYCFDCEYVSPDILPMSPMCSGYMQELISHPASTRATKIWTRKDMFVSLLRGMAECVDIICNASSAQTGTEVLVRNRVFAHKAPPNNQSVNMNLNLTSLQLPHN